jgi:hydroxypyruvate isomerase
MNTLPDMRVDANLSIMFRESPFPERFARARAAGFTVVEFWWPSGEDLAAVQEAIADAGVSVVLFNFDAGEMPAGDRGLLSDPERAERFRDNVPVALALADRLGVKMLNALVGVELEGVGRERQLELARENVAWAADQAAASGATVLIEALNTFENGPYLLSSTRQAADFIASVGRPNVLLQYDVYHMQRMEGNLVATIREHIGEIAHIQVADSPGRGEPGTGEINFAYVLAAIEALGYGGFVGLEYLPAGESTETGLGWVPEPLRGADRFAPDELNL